MADDGGMSREPRGLVTQMRLVPRPLRPRQHGPKRIVAQQGTEHGQLLTPTASFRESSKIRNMLATVINFPL